MKYTTNVFFMSYMVSTLMSNVLFNMMLNQGKFSLKMFLFATLLTTSFYFIGTAIKKMYPSLVKANKQNREYRKKNPIKDEPW